MWWINVYVSGTLQAYTNAIRENGGRSWLYVQSIADEQRDLDQPGNLLALLFLFFLYLDLLCIFIYIYIYIYIYILFVCPFYLFDLSSKGTEGFRSCFGLAALLTVIFVLDRKMLDSLCS